MRRRPRPRPAKHPKLQLFQVPTVLRPGLRPDRGETMKNFRWFVGTAIALTAFPAVAASSGGISAQRLSDVDKFISSDAFEGRGPATRAETKTIDYIAAQYKAIGLKPAGDMVNGQRSWFQNVPLLKSDITASQFALNLGNGQTVQLTQGTEIALKA